MHVHLYGDFIILFFSIFRQQYKFLRTHCYVSVLWNGGCSIIKKDALVEKIHHKVTAGKNLLFPFRYNINLLARYILFIDGILELTIV
jgi:hypothetical protein